MIHSTLQENNVLSNKRMLIIQLHAYACASDLFACMLNPEYRGSDFKWNKLRSMVIHRTAGSLFSSGREIKNKEEDTFLKIQQRVFVKV